MTLFNDYVRQPLVRGKLRRRVGKWYYQSRRRLKWLTESKNYAKERSKHVIGPALIEHQSFLLRPLQGLDMQLQYNKITNLRLAIACLDGVIIKPGQTFSLWYLVGKPTRHKGYLPGLVLNQGKIASGIGGGLCQLGNLLCWMAMHTPLTIVERYRHGYDVFPDVNRKIPFGSGATLSYNYIDLQLKNETAYTFQLSLYLTEEYLKGVIYCNEEVPERYLVFEDNHRIVHQSWGGYTRHNQIKRKVTRGDEVTEELIFENHAIMQYNPLLTQ